MNQRNPVALVTGASRGIGRAVAKEFAAHGYDLILICRRRSDLLEQLAAGLEPSGIRCGRYIADVQNYEDIEGIYGQAVTEIGAPNVIVNNAGISHIGLLTEMTPMEWQEVIGVNLTGVFNICRLFCPDMIRRQSGRVINISSVWGNLGASCEAAYAASKGGVNSLTRSLAKELAPSHITVNAIACGVIDTEMNQFLSDAERQRLIDEIPACRMGTPQEVARMVLLLARAPEYLTGQVITMDGGWT